MDHSTTAEEKRTDDDPRGVTLEEWAKRLGVRWRDMRKLTVAELERLTAVYNRGRQDGWKYGR